MKEMKLRKSTRVGLHKYNELGTKSGLAKTFYSFSLRRENKTLRNYFFTLNLFECCKSRNGPALFTTACPLKGTDSSSFEKRNLVYSFVKLVPIYWNSLKRLMSSLFQLNSGLACPLRSCFINGLISDSNLQDEVWFIWLSSFSIYWNIFGSN